MRDGGAPGRWCAAEAATAHALVSPDALVADDLVIDGPDGHHLARVRRVRVGEVLTVADGAGRWRTAEVRDVRGGALVAVATGPVTVEPQLEPRLTVAFAPAKGDQPESTVQRLTELGVDEIVPLVTRRGVVRWDAARTPHALARLRRVAREAVLQCRRARLPEVGEPVTLAEVAARAGVVVADRDGVPPGAGVLPATEGWTLVVGPEGGLAPEELATLAGTPRLAAGPHVLRAGTAAVAVAAALYAFRVPAIRPDFGRF